MTKLETIGAAILWAICIAATARAQDCVDVRQISSGSVEYNALNNAPTVERITLSFSLSVACQASGIENLGQIRIGFLTRMNTRSADELQFDIRYGGASVLARRGDAPRYQTLDYRGRTSGSADFELILPKGQFAKAVSNQVDIVAWQVGDACGDDSCNSVSLEPADMLVLDIRSAEVFSLQLAGGGDSQTVDLGEISSGEESPRVVIEARATGPFKITLESENDGSLRRTESRGRRTEDRIEYAAIVDGVEVGKWAYTERSRSGTQGSTVQIAFWIRVGDASGKRAGTYKDQITLTIEPLGL